MKFYNKIKIDPFPNLEPGEFKTSLHDEFLKKVYSVFGSIFKLSHEREMEQRFCDYLNSLSAERLHDFFNSTDFVEKIEELSDEYDAMKSVLLFSFVESLSPNDFTKLNEWLPTKADAFIKLETKKDVEATLAKLFEKYFIDHGSSQKFYSILRDNLNTDEKFHLIQLITFGKVIKKTGIAPCSFPICFHKDNEICNKHIQAGEGLSYHCINICDKLKDPNELEKKFKKLVGRLYDMRSNFIHEAKMPCFVWPHNSSCEQFILEEMIKRVPVSDNIKDEKKEIEVLAKITYGEFRDLIILACIRHLLKNEKTGA